LSGYERARTGRVGVEAAHIGEHPDLDNIIGNLSTRGGRSWAPYLCVILASLDWLTNPSLSSS
jgi:hypothetical protein